MDSSETEYYEKFKQSVVSNSQQPIFDELPNRERSINLDSDEDYIYEEDIPKATEDTPKLINIPKTELMDLIAEKEGCNKIISSRKRSAKPKKQKEPENPQEKKVEGLPYMYMNMPLGGMIDGKEFVMLNQMNLSLYYPMTSEQITELVKLREMFIQLLIQAYLMSSNSNTKKRAYFVLYDLCRRYDYIIRCCLKHIGKYQIDVINLKGCNEPISVYPYCSMFQSHLMEVIEPLLEKKTTYSLKETRDLLSLYIPLSNKRLLPVSSDMVKPNTARKKFSYLDDHLLLTGLEEFGYQKMSQIQAKWLPKKTEKEIKHRYKNLICLKAPDNIIKAWKKMSDEPLNKIEQEKLLKGVSWFGKKKWAVISKYMCLNRPPEQIAKIYAQLMNSQYPGKVAAKAKQKSTKESLPNIMDYISQKPIDDNWNDITIEDIKEGNDSDIFSTCSLNI